MTCCDVYSRQQFLIGQCPDCRLSHRVLQRGILQDIRLQSGRGHAEVLQVCVHVWRAHRQGDDRPCGPRPGATAARSVRDSALQEKQSVLMSQKLYAPCSARFISLSLFGS